MSISLRQKIFALITAMGLITVVCGGAILWYTVHIDEAVSTIVHREITAYRAAQEMQMALSNQKGFLTYYFLDSEPKWLKELGTYRQMFQDYFQQAQNLSQTKEQKRVLCQIEQSYAQYIRFKDRVIHTYKKETTVQKISYLHREQRDLFFQILDMCETYKQIQWNRIVQARQESQARAESLRIIVVFAVSCFVLLSGFLALILYRQILDPIRQLAHETGGHSGETGQNEVQFLSASLHCFLEDFDFAHNELTWSREHLEQAEKMALVGKLAAGVAHTIRNPFTSIKMRLFSLSRSLNLSANDQEDFDVISEEMSRIDTIVQNFLEFARPPKLKMQPCQVQNVIDSALQLLKYRLQSHDVRVRVQSVQDVPQVWADPEQLKEALINLLINAYESMAHGGWIEISIKVRAHSAGRQVVLWVQDNGQGIVSTIQSRIMQPFFTTKEDGTGLGLSIVSRIVEEHGGTLQFVSRPGQGTTFEIVLPVKEGEHEPDSDH